jgi:cyanobactin maturation PatA/PatG family protease
MRQILLASASDCADKRATDCSRLLAGRLNVKGALSLISQGAQTMSEVNQTPPTVGLPDQGGSLFTPATTAVSPSGPVAGSVSPTAAVWPAACGCATCGGTTQLVYALGQLDYDLVSEARLDSLVQKMGPQSGGMASERALAFDPQRLLVYLDQHPWDAAAIEWTLRVDNTPIYAIRPQGAFAETTYQVLRRFLRDRLAEGAERVSIPGRLNGMARLLSGQTVPVVVPDPRGLYCWTTQALVTSVVGSPPAAEAPAEHHAEHERRHAGVRDFLDRVYHELRNLGLSPQERALNYSATNAFQVERVYESVLKERERMELDSINVTRSPICRPHSDCWDVELYFFFPERQVQTVRKVYRFSVDVSDVVPVTVGKTRSWFTR